MKALLALAAVVTLAGCAHNDVCVQPDPVEPQKQNCWNKGVNCGMEIVPVNGK